MGVGNWVRRMMEYTAVHRRRAGDRRGRRIREQTASQVLLLRLLAAMHAATSSRSGNCHSGNWKIDRRKSVALAVKNYSLDHTEFRGERRVWWRDSEEECVGKNEKKKHQQQHVVGGDSRTRNDGAMDDGVHGQDAVAPVTTCSAVAAVHSHAAETERAC